MPTVFIDRVTGTWGMADDIVFVDADMAGQHMDPEGDEYTCYATLDEGSDSTITGVAWHSIEHDYGVSAPVVISAYKQRND